MSSSKKTMGDFETEVNSPPPRTLHTLINDTSGNKRLNWVENEDQPVSLT
jgi:hypothetical protein